MQAATQSTYTNPQILRLSQVERPIRGGAALVAAAKTLAVIAALWCLPNAVAAQSPNDAGHEEIATAGEARLSGSPEPDATGRDGLMLRLAVGPAAIGTGIEVDGDEVLCAGGGGGALNAQIGAALVRNLFLHGELLVVGTAHGVDQNDDGSEFRADGLALGGAGAGLTYFFMPYNVSVGGTVMFAVSGVKTESGEEFDTDAGVLLKLQVDKQWQVTRWFGFGVGGAFFGGFGRGKTESGDVLNAGYAGVTLQLVGTYN